MVHPSGRSKETVFYGSPLGAFQRDFYPPSPVSLNLAG